MACDAFELVPYVALVIDDKNSTVMFILSLQKLIEINPPKKQINWNMGKKWIEKYSKEPDIKIVEYKHDIKYWWKG